MRKKLSAKAYIAKLSKEKRKKLVNIEILTKEMMRTHGVGHYKFTFSRRKKTAGYCSADRISLNVHFCLRSSEKELRNTIPHEIPHAIVGARKGHRKIWQDKARELGVTWRINYRE